MCKLFFFLFNLSKGVVTGKTGSELQGSGGLYRKEVKFNGVKCGIEIEIWTGSYFVVEGNLEIVWTGRSTVPREQFLE